MIGLSTKNHLQYADSSPPLTIKMPPPPVLSPKASIASLCSPDCVTTELLAIPGSYPSPNVPDSDSSRPSSPYTGQMTSLDSRSITTSRNSKSPQVSTSVRVSPTASSHRTLKRTSWSPLAFGTIVEDIQEELEEEQALTQKSSAEHLERPHRGSGWMKGDTLWNDKAGEPTDHSEKRRRRIREKRKRQEKKRKEQIRAERMSGDLRAASMS